MTDRGHAIEVWNDALDVIEQRLETHLDVSEIARSALTDEFHFRRVFSTLTGLTLSEYVRGRRMTRAVAAVTEGREPLDVIAHRYGYGSPDSFSRAFRSIHGVSPQQARRDPSVRFSSLPRVVLHLRVDGAREIGYRLRWQESFALVGVCTRVPVVPRGTNEPMTQWVESIDEETWARIDALSDRVPGGMLAVCTAFEEDGPGRETMQYWQAVATALDTPPGGLDRIEVPAASWAVLSTDGAFPEAIQDMFFEAYTRWLPANAYVLLDLPQLVRAQYGDAGECTAAELWLPVVRSA